MGPKILVIEDESSIADNILYALKTEGFASEWFSKGSAALEALRERDFDLALLDLGLPDINGFELFKEIKKIKEMPIIFLTARSEEIDRVVGLEIGADDYIGKPFSPRELTARIKAVLRRSKPSPKAESAPAATTAQGFSVDEMRCHIHFHGKLLELSRYEYLLLKVFVDAPGRVFSRDQLMDKVWDDPLSSQDRTVDAHIKGIRAELKKVRPDLDPIETHRGMGYSLKETK
jgi:Response regulators consisting of a CheY-like receiver domain and a winged-helix DNA-binding domain